MKKLLFLALALAMILSLVACGSTASPPASSAPAASSPAASEPAAPAASEPAAPKLNPPKHGDKYVFGISQPFMGHPVRQAGQQLIDEWMKGMSDKVEVIVTDGQLNAQKQIADLEDLIAKDVDIILVAAHQSATLVSVLREAKEAGIPVIAFDRVLTDTSVQIASIINDEFNGGASCGELMVEATGGNAKIAILQGPAGNTGALLRNDGFMSVVSQYSGIEIAAVQVAEFQRVQAVDVFEDILQANPDLTAVFCHNDEMALGVVQVLESAGRMDDIIVIGYDGQKDALESIMAGKLYGTVRRIMEFPEVLEMAYEHVTTGTITNPNVFLPPLKITEKNVDEVYNPDAVF